MSSGMPPQIGIPDDVNERAITFNFFLRCNRFLNIQEFYQLFLFSALNNHVMAGEVGLEPTTSGLTVRCSAN